MSRLLVLAAVLLLGVAPTRHAEDSPGWNCKTMGNHVCGPAAYPAWERPQEQPSTQHETQTPATAFRAGAAPEGGHA